MNETMVIPDKSVAQAILNQITKIDALLTNSSHLTIANSQFLPLLYCCLKAGSLIAGEREHDQVKVPSQLPAIRGGNGTHFWQDVIIER